MPTRAKRWQAVLIALLAVGQPACSEHDILKLNAWMFSTKAQTRLALMYRTGNGVEKDPAEAARWYRKAAARGNPTAQLWLGSFYEAGEGVPRDPAEAVRLYRLAAEQDNAGAQLALGRCYEKGIGVAPDPVSAHAWVHLAALNGISRAFVDLKRLQAVLGPEQIAEARRRTFDLFDSPEQGGEEPS